MYLTTDMGGCQVFFLYSSSILSFYAHAPRPTLRYTHRYRGGVYIRSRARTALSRSAIPVFMGTSMMLLRFTSHASSGFPRSSALLPSLQIAYNVRSRLPARVTDDLEQLLLNRCNHLARAHTVTVQPFFLLSELLIDFLPKPTGKPPIGFGGFILSHQP